MFEIGVLRRICERKTEGLTGGLGNLRSVKLPNLYSSDIIKAIKSWRMRPSVHAAHIAKANNEYYTVF
jgi:hypothetical protein